MRNSSTVRRYSAKRLGNRGPPQVTGVLIELFVEFRILGNTRTACMNKQFNCSLGFERRLRIELSKTGIPFRLYDADKKRKRIAINPNGIFEDSVFTNDLRAIA